MWRQVVILRHRLWAVSTYKNISAAEECGQICEMQIKCDRIAGAWAREGQRSYSRLQTSEIDLKADYFSLICTCRSGFPSTPSGSLTSLKGVTSFSVNEEKLPMEKRTFGIRSDEASIWCVFIQHELKSINQSSFSLTTPFVWKLCWSSSFTETLQRARTSTCPLLVASLPLLLPLRSEAHSTAKTGTLKAAIASLRDDVNLKSCVWKPKNLR